MQAILVVALAGGALDERVAAELARLFGDDPGHELPRHARRDGVALVVGVGLYGHGDPLVGELVAHVDEDRLEAHLAGVGPRHLHLFVALAYVDGDGDDLLRLVLPAQQLYAQTRVEAAAERAGGLLRLVDRRLLYSLDDILNLAHSHSPFPRDMQGVSQPVRLEPKDITEMRRFFKAKSVSRRPPRGSRAKRAFLPAARRL